MTGVELAFLDDYDVSHILQVNNLADEIHLIEATESLRTRLNSEYVAKTEETKVRHLRQELNPRRNSDAPSISFFFESTNMTCFF